MALEAWEIAVIVIIILLLLRPSIIVNAARSIGKIVGEYKKGRSNRAS